MNQSISEELKDELEAMDTEAFRKGMSLDISEIVEYCQSKISQAYDRGYAANCHDCDYGVKEKEKIEREAIAEDRKELREKVEGMKTYTGGSSVNEKDKRVNKQEVLSLLEEK